MSDVPRLRLSAAAFALAGGAPRAATAPAPPDVLAELSAVGALVRRGDGALVVDPTVTAALRLWASAAVGVDAVARRGAATVHVEAAAEPPLAVCVVRSRLDGRDLDTVDVCVPPVSGLLEQVARCAAGDEPPESLWIRVRSRAGTWLGHWDAGSADPVTVRRGLVRPLLLALEATGRVQR